MNEMYQYNLSQFKKNRVSVDRLTKEINESSITIELNYINTDYIKVDMYFFSGLTTSDVTILDTIVANHSGDPLPEEPKIVRTEVLTEHLKYVESGDVTQGLFAAESIVIDVPSGETTVIRDISWKFIVSIKSGTLGVSESMIGDELEIQVSPNTIVGALMYDIRTGDTTLFVSPTVIQNMKRGYYIGLLNGTKLGRVSEIGDTYVIVDTPSTVNVSAGNYVTLTVKIIPYLYFADMSTVEIGKNIPAGQRLPANTVIRIVYKNNNATAKKVSFFAEYLY